MPVPGALPSGTKVTRVHSAAWTRVGRDTCSNFDIGDFLSVRAERESPVLRDRQAPVVVLGPPPSGVPSRSGTYGVPQCLPRLEETSGLSAASLRHRQPRNSSKRDQAIAEAQLPVVQKGWRGQAAAAKIRGGYRPEYWGTRPFRFPADVFPRVARFRYRSSHNTNKVGIAHVWTWHVGHLWAR